MTSLGDLVPLLQSMENVSFIMMTSPFQVREYEGDDEPKIRFHNPRNTVAVEFFFRGEKMAKVMGSLVCSPLILSPSHLRSKLED